MRENKTNSRQRHLKMICTKNRTRIKTSISILLTLILIFMPNPALIYLCKLFRAAHVSTKCLISYVTNFPAPHSLCATRGDNRFILTQKIQIHGMTHLSLTILYMVNITLQIPSTPILHLLASLSQKIIKQEALGFSVLIFGQMFTQQPTSQSPPHTTTHKIGKQQPKQPNQTPTGRKTSYQKYPAQQTNLSQTCIKSRNTPQSIKRKTNPFPLCI